MRLLIGIGVLLIALLGTAVAVPSETRADTTPYQLNVPVLMYHRIQCPDPSEKYPGLFICPDAFDSQMALIAADGWQTITADQLADDMLAGVCPGPKTFVVTIDDGALDGYTTGAPILEKYGFRGTFAMVVGKVGDYLTDPTVAKPHFDWDQARELVARGHGIANHTMTHVSVDTLTTTAKLDAQIQAAEDQLQSQLGFAPKVFVYPSGATGTADALAYLNARFELALTTAYGAVESTTNPMRAPRIRVDPSMTPETVLATLTRFADPCANTTPSPKIKLTPTSAKLGYVVTGTTSKPTTVTVKNTGTADLHVSSVALSGVDSAEFGVVSDGCSAVAVPVNGTCAISVSFSPQSDGAKTASLDVNSDASGTPVVSAVLSGTGGPPVNGSIDIHLAARPQGSQPFSFSVNNGQTSFSLVDDGTSVSTMHLDLPSATYTIAVAAVAGWSLTGLTCTQPEVINKAGGKVTIALTDGVNVSCTFTESQRIPDASIATTQDGPYEQAGFVSLVPTLAQTVTASVAAGDTTTMYVHLANAGPAKDNFAVRAVVAPSPYFSVRFTAGGVDVTNAVNKGRWWIAVKNSGERLLVVTVSAAQTVPAGSFEAFTVKLRSRTTRNTWDVVGATVNGI